MQRRCCRRRCDSDTLAGCDAPSEYYRAMLDTYCFWQQTWKREGRMEVSLPRRNDTDGAHLAAQARYALVLDMITRTGEEFWPRYGTAPGCEHLSTTATAHSDSALSTRHAEAEPVYHALAF